MKRIFLFFMLVSTAFGMRAQEAAYTISLPEAVWNFDDYEGTKPSVSSNSYLVPQNWIVGNGGSSKKNSPAYCPFIYPYTGDATSSYGYDGRLCMRIYHNASTSRTPPFAVLPLIRDVDYSQLQLTFMGKGEQSSSSATYSNRLRIGYITSLADTLKANFNAAVVNFHDEELPTSGYQQYTISLSGIPAGARIVLYDDDSTVNNSILLDNIRITQDPNSVTQPFDTTAISCGAFTWEGQTYTQSGDYSINKQTADGTEQITLDLTINQSYHFEEYLTACDSIEWQGTTYTESGDYTFSDTTVNGCDSTTVLHLTINKSTYEERSETHTDSIIWNGQILKESGDYIFSDTTVNGCDSTIVLHLTIEPTSALSNTTLQVAVWPNPTTEVLHLQAEGGTEIYIFDATGQLVIRQPYADTLNVSTLPSGMYLIRLQTTNGQTATTPFIKK